MEIFIGKNNCVKTRTQENPYFTIMSVINEAFPKLQFWESLQ